MTALEREVLDALPVTICAVDLDGHITYLNRSWSRFVQQDGTSRDGEPARTGMSIWDALPDPALHARIRQAMVALSEGRATSLSWEVPRSSSTDERMFLMQISAIGDTRAVSGYVLSAVDITSSHRSRELLIDTGIALARTITVDRVVQEVAQQLLRTTTCESVVIALSDEETGDLRLAHHSGVDAADIGDRLASAWDEAIRAREIVSHAVPDALEITAPMASNSVVIGAITLSVASSVAPHRLDEVRRALSTIAVEACAAVERARFVRRMEHKKRLDAVAEVSAGVAHELRNPLFGIASAAQLLRFRVKDDPVVEKNVGRILREVERLNSMVASLLEYGRPNPVRAQPGDPDAIWDTVLERHRGRLESRAILVNRTRVPTATNCPIDAQQLAQVFTNVLVNAAEAAPESSDLTLHSSVLSNGAWRCRLQNGGAAIPAEALPRVFEMFFTTKPGATGIGLAQCQRIIDEHGGTIAIESAPDAGTAVTIVLPPRTA